MNIIELYQDHGIPFQTEGHKHCRPGWINTPCPFCTGNPGLHLGVTENGSHFYCWRCGGHPVLLSIATLLNVSIPKAKQITLHYGGISAVKPKISAGKKNHKLPTGVTPLLPQHQSYLEKRGFDPDQLEKEWGLVGTGPVALLDDLNYKHRIIAPIYWDGQRVSFQGRDITNKHPLKYMACPQIREIMDHKTVLYGRQDSWGETGIAVEGITDVWKLGKYAFGTFGIKFKNEQLRIIGKSFKRVAIIFDDDPQAIKEAKILEAELCFRGVDAFRIDIEGDPGGLSQDDAKHLVNSII